MHVRWPVPGSGGNFQNNIRHFVQHAQPKGGVQSGYQKDVIRVRALVDGFHGLFECYVYNHRGRSPDVSFSVGSMFG